MDAVIVGTDSALHEKYSALLLEMGFDILGYEDVVAALHHLVNSEPELILTLGGLSVLALRLGTEAMIVSVTPQDENLTIRLLIEGADYHILATASDREFVARINAAMRRLNGEFS